MPTKQFDVEFVEDAIYYGKYHVDEIVNDSGRWMEYVTTIIENPETGKLYEVDWERGLTEMQENEFPWSYWDGKDSLVELKEVEPYEETIVVKKYRVVE